MGFASLYPSYDSTILMEATYPPFGDASQLVISRKQQPRQLRGLAEHRHDPFPQPRRSFRAAQQFLQTAQTTLDDGTLGCVLLHLPFDLLEIAFHDFADLGRVNPRPRRPATPGCL